MDHARATEILGRNLAACHRCPRRQKMCAGACACGEDGRDILDHASFGDCPIGKHSPNKMRGLGDWVAAAVRVFGVDRLMKLRRRLTGKGCGCQRRRALLNRIFPFS